MSCVCGHAVEEHANGGACAEEVEWNGGREPCRCGHYEEAENEDENDE